MHYGLAKLVSIGQVEDNFIIAEVTAREIEKGTGIKPDKYDSFKNLNETNKEYDLYVFDNDTGEDTTGEQEAKKHPGKVVLYTAGDSAFQPKIAKSNLVGLIDFIKSFFGL